MYLATRHPMMKAAPCNESGVFATYALSVIATVSSAVSAALLVGSVATAQPLPALLLQPIEAGPVWVNVGVPQPPKDKTAAGLSKPGLEIAGADLLTDQPVYSEASGMVVRSRSPGI